jgi:hypothetical protein
MNKKRSGGRRVLDGYKKVGGTFIPPLIHRVGSLDYISWSTQTMPELIWWDVLLDQASHRFAVNVAGEIGKHFKAVKGRRIWWGFISDYAQLSTAEICDLKDHMKRTGILDRFLESLGDFLNLYPECPFSGFLDHRPTGIIDVGYLSHFEDRMRDLENKRSRNAVLVQAQVVYIGFVSGRLRVRRGLALADFPEVQHYPSTDRSKQVGASICATVNMLAGTSLPKYREDNWVQYFWRRSLELKPLNFGYLENQ